jgi:hypothetical protein
MKTRVTLFLTTLLHLPVAGAAALPQDLRGTGLFVDGSTTVVSPDAQSFSPQYPLWSDGAIKRRWIALPAGAAVDASNPDAWEFPRGTRLWKEFAVDGRRIETRFVEREADGAWRFASYVWNEDGTAAILASADGATLTVKGRRYVVPSETDCRACHEGSAVPVLGFSALQLSPDRDPLAPHADATSAADLRTLVHSGRLRGLPRSMLDQPPRIHASTPVARAALGYLHGNCGHCHSASTDAAVPVGLRLAQSASAASPDDSLRTLVGVLGRFRPAGTSGRLALAAPGHAADSLVVRRMRARDPQTQMPPLGTAVPDSDGLALVERWIDHDLSPDHPESSP